MILLDTSSKVQQINVLEEYLNKMDIVPLNIFGDKKSLLKYSTREDCKAMMVKHHLVVIVFTKESFANPYFVYYADVARELWTDEKIELLISYKGITQDDILYRFKWLSKETMYNLEPAGGNHFFAVKVAHILVNKIFYRHFKNIEFKDVKEEYLQLLISELDSLNNSDYHGRIVALRMMFVMLDFNEHIKNSYLEKINKYIFMYSDNFMRATSVEADLMAKTFLLAFKGYNLYN
ncbi:MAG: hypothetical protein Q4F06_06195 [Eubacteriales bacterium]|nr:hypothetical protein [Eubacteriales bacterium]